jgi:hypothetical protein
VKRTEEIKAAISGDLWIGQSRWSFKRDVYMQLITAVSSASVELRTLVTHFDLIDNATSEGAKVFLSQQLRGVQVTAMKAIKDLLSTKNVAAVVVADEALKAILRLDEEMQRLKEIDDTRADTHEAEARQTFCDILELLNAAANRLTAAARRDLLTLGERGVKSDPVSLDTVSTTTTMTATKEAGHARQAAEVDSSW